MSISKYFTDTTIRVLSSIALLFISITIVYVSVNSILIPIFATIAANSSITLFHALCVLTVFEIYIFLLHPAAPLVKHYFEKMIEKFVAESDKEIAETVSLSPSTLYCIARTCVCAIDLVCSLIIALLV